MNYRKDRPTSPIRLFSPILVFAVGCTGTIEPADPCPAGLARAGNQCIPSQEPVLGCTDRFAENFTPRANVDDGSCTFSGIGCTDPNARNYNPTATTDDGSCEVGGCTSMDAVNYKPEASFDDASCRFIATFEVDMNGVSDFDTADGVYVHGTFNNWCGTCAVLTDGDADGIYRGTVAVTVGAHQFRFVIGSDPIREEVVPDGCDVIEDPVERARGLVMPDTNTTFDELTFEGCDTAPPGELPLAVDEVYAPSGFMGDGELGGIVAGLNCPMRAGDAVGECHDFTYTPAANGWGGIFWQYPDGNWGSQPGYAMPAGATRVTFWAWGASGGELAKFLVGMQGPDGFALETVERPLTTVPTEYTIDLGAITYTDVVGAFGWVSPAPSGGGTITIYVDDITWEAGSTPGDGCTNSAAVNYDPTATVDDGSCEFEVQFAVDMSCTPDTFTTVFITGPFCDWCGDGFELLDADSDGTFTGTFPFKNGPLEFKYMVDNFSGQEDLLDDVLAGNGQCAPITDSATFANRQISVDGPMSTMDAYGRCTACP